MQIILLEKVLNVGNLGDVVKVHMRAGDHQLLAKLPEHRYTEIVELTGKAAIASWDAEDVQLLRD